MQIALLKLHSYIRVKDHIVGDLDITTQLATGVSVKSYYSNSNSMISINYSTTHKKKMIPEKQGTAPIVLTLEGY